MINKNLIKELIQKTIDEILSNKKISSLDEDFISIDSKLESIEIAQIIARSEELLEENGFKGYDLFEKVYEFEELTFTGLIDFIHKDLNKV